MGKKIRMALYDSDGYMISLVKYLCRKKQEIVETRLFTNPSMLQGYVREGQVDVVLAQEEEADWVIGLQGLAPKIILLSEGNMVREAEGYIPVFRYQSAEEVVREVMEAVAEDDRIAYTGAVTVRRQGEIICGFAPFGGGGVSTFLAGMAKELAQNYRTLYVCLEEFDGMEYLPQERKGQDGEVYHGMSEVLYYLRQRKDRLALKLESLVYEREQVDYLPAVENYHDLYQMSTEDMAHMLNIFFEETPYERLVFDVGYLGEAMEYLLEQSDRVYMPAPRNPMQEKKQKACEQAWRKLGKEEIIKKICRVAMDGNAAAEYTGRE